MPVKKDQREKGRNRRRREVDIAGPTTCRYRRADDILQGRQHVDIAGPAAADKGKNALWRTKVWSTDKEAMGREEAGGRPEERHIEEQTDKEGQTEKKLEVSVGLVRRRAARRSGKGESQRPTTVVGRRSGETVGRGRRARRRHMNVRSSYHFRVRTKQTVFN
ncbi:hypothetical protein BY996DRAFT_6525137 [Phakopsora pachyrhizi]|nr:hypothetical protein BY996DRAFT_6525137 [Phakopsora pachyrhizi]